MSRISKHQFSLKKYQRQIDSGVKFASCLDLESFTLVDRHWLDILLVQMHKTDILSSQKSAVFIRKTIKYVKLLDLSI